ncbi:MAG: helical backbone metal receptor [Planctomycetota bacterium]
MLRRTLLIAFIGLAAGSAASVGLLQVSQSAGDSAGGTDRHAADRSRPQRIVCMSPAVTEMVYALEQGSRVVGRSQFATYPPEARAKPSCGGFINPNTEKILSLQPDLILTQGLGKKLRRFSQKHGIRLVRVELTDLQSIYDAIRRIGDVLRCPARADLVTARMRMKLAQVRLRTADREPRRVLLVVGREPGTLGSLNTAGGGSYLDDIVQRAGGINIFGGLESRYRQVSREAVARRRPEVIVELRGEGMVSSEKTKQIKQAWDAMPFLPAVRQDRIYVVKSTYALVPGPRVVKLARRLTDVIHGEEGRK